MAIGDAFMDLGDAKREVVNHPSFFDSVSHHRIDGLQSRDSLPDWFGFGGKSNFFSLVIKENNEVLRKCYR